jgi:hypothetical protein
MLISKKQAVCVACSRPHEPARKTYAAQQDSEVITLACGGQLIRARHLANDWPAPIEHCPGLDLGPVPVRPACGTCDQRIEAVCLLRRVHCGDSQYTAGVASVGCLYHQDFAAYRTAATEYARKRAAALAAGAVEVEEADACPSR